MDKTPSGRRKTSLRAYLLLEFQAEQIFAAVPLKPIENVLLAAFIALLQPLGDGVILALVLGDGVFPGFPLTVVVVFFHQGELGYPLEAALEEASPSPERVV